MIIVCDSSALITLALVNQLSLLEQLFGKVQIPQGVYEEVVVRGAGRVGAGAVRDASFIKVAEATHEREAHTTDPALSRADREIIALAQARAADLVITRDRRLVKRLRQQGIAAATVGDVLVVAKERGVIESVRAVLDEMKEKGVLIRDAAYRALLRQAGEQ